MSEFRIDRPLPPFMTQLHELSRDVFRHSINIFKKVDDIIFNTRLSECNKCKKYRSDKRCAKCGCLTEIKLRWEVTKCPIGKW